MDNCGSMISGAAESLSNGSGKHISKPIPLQRTDSGSCEALHNDGIRTPKSSDSAAAARLGDKKKRTDEEEAEAAQEANAAAGAAASGGQNGKNGKRHRA
jgi:hypothetical protein